MLGDRPAQSFGVDGGGIDEPLQSDSAELRQDGNRGVLGGDVLAQVGAERLVPFAEDPG